ncbi:MAG: hypothetical protein P9E88_14810 [Candidatus Competibacter sp.]|nr:hypothetical protein [Candidatus Competibacter sp.]MDS4057290.1 hypothetical protein [Candidatus Contendobacter sp.]
MDDFVAFAAARRQSRGELVAGWLDGGTIKVYDGTRPATPDTVITSQTLLVIFELPDPAGTVTNGVWEADVIDAAMIAATGTAAWARLFDATGAVIADLDVGLTDSDAALWLDNLSLVAGGLVTVTGLTIAEV